MSDVNHLSSDCSSPDQWKQKCPSQRKEQKKEY